MRLQAKDIVLSDSLEITPLLIGPLQNKVFESQQTNSHDHSKSQRVLASPQRLPAHLLRYLVSIHLACHDVHVLRLASSSYFQHGISTTSKYAHGPSSMELIRLPVHQWFVLVPVKVRHRHRCKCVILLSLFLYLKTLSQTLDIKGKWNLESAYTNAFVRPTSFTTSHTAIYSQIRSAIWSPRLQGRRERNYRARHSVNDASCMDNGGRYTHQIASFPSRFCHNSRQQPSSQPIKQLRSDVLSVFIESKYLSDVQFL